jgi:hypothetical protein
MTAMKGILGTAAGFAVLYTFTVGAASAGEEGGSPAWFWTSVLGFIVGVVWMAAGTLISDRVWTWRPAVWRSYPDNVSVGLKRYDEKVEIKELDPDDDDFDEQLYEATAKARERAMVLNMTRKELGR